MELAALLMLALMLLMLLASPLGKISPSALLAGAWAFVFVLQSLFASDMKSSALATFAICVVSLSFAVGELAACGGIRLRRRNHDGRASTILSPKDDSTGERKFRSMVITFGVLAILGVIAYAKAMGLLEARSLADLILLPGIARVEVYSGQRVIPAYSKVCLLFAYPGVVLALAYYYLYRWRWWLLLPMVGVLLFGVTESGRAGTMIVIVQVALAVYLKNVIILKRNLKRLLMISVVMPAALIVFVFVGMEFLREGFSSTGLDAIVRIMTSSRAYLFGGLSAFSFWCNHIYEPLTLTYGKYSFSSLFNALGIAKQEVGIYDFYAPISSNNEVSNVYTAYRSFIEDYTIVGACFIYCSAGAFIGSLTSSISKGKRIMIPVLIPLLSWLALSPMFSATYFDSFLLSCVLPYFLVRQILGGGKWTQSA